jgi:hypothetical protein
MVFWGQNVVDNYEVVAPAVAHRSSIRSDSVIVHNHLLRNINMHF